MQKAPRFLLPPSMRFFPQRRARSDCGNANRRRPTYLRWRTVSHRRNCRIDKLTFDRSGEKQVLCTGRVFSRESPLLRVKVFWGSWWYSVLVETEMNGMRKKLRRAIYRPHPSPPLKRKEIVHRWIKKINGITKNIFCLKKRLYIEKYFSNSSTVSVR